MEFFFGSNPNNVDTDQDGLTDGDEFRIHKTDLLRADSDEDGSSDFLEVVTGADPLDPDSTPSGFVGGLTLYAPMEEKGLPGELPNLLRPELPGLIDGAGVSFLDDGVLGENLVISDADSSIRFPDVFNAGWNQLTVSFWLRPESSANDRTIISGVGSGGETRWSLTQVGDAVRLTGSSGEVEASGLQVGEWQLITMVILRETGAARVTVGDEEAIGNVEFSAADGEPDSLVIGSFSEGGPASLIGIDELAAWTRALNAEQLAGLKSGPQFELSVPALGGPLALPVIGREAADVVAIIGQDLQIDLQVEGPGNFTVEWQKDDQLIDGESTTILNLEDLSAQDSGLYTATVSNFAGSVTSAPIKVSVVERRPQFVTRVDHENLLEFGDEVVALSGDYLAIGSQATNFQKGGVSVYFRDQGGSGNWGMIALILNETDFGNFERVGRVVALDQKILAFTNSITRERNEVQIHELSPDGMTMLQRIRPNANDVEFGLALALHGDVLAVSSRDDRANDSTSGRVHLYQKNESGQWQLFKTLSASRSTLDDDYGMSLALSDGILAVGARSDWDDGRESGAVYLYERDLGGPDQWGEKEKLKADQVVRFGKFGSAVALAGDVLSVGALWTEEQFFVDYLFDRNPDDGTWSQRKQFQSKIPNRDRVQRRYRNSISSSGNQTVSMNSEAEIYWLFDHDIPSGAPLQNPAPTLGDVTQAVAISGDTIFIGPDQILTLPAVEPFIEHQPKSLSVNNGGSAEFEVFPLGSPPLSIQWFKDGGIIEGATSAKLAIDVVSSFDSGEYQAVISNDFGQVESRIATLVSDVPAMITEELVLPARRLDGSFRFEVMAVGSDLKIQWYQNGEIIPGATDPVFEIESPDFSDAGKYSVEVSNSLNTVRSSEVELTLEKMIPLQLAKLKPGNADRNGSDVDLFGTLAISGAPGTQPSGRAFIYQFNQLTGEWETIAILRPSNFPEVTQVDGFGASVAINGEIAVVGAPRTDGPNSLNAGLTFVFRRSGDQWLPDGTLQSDLEIDSSQGRTVRLDGDSIFVGSDGGLEEFKRNSDGNWERVTLLDFRRMGFNGVFAIHRRTLVVGLPGDFSVEGSRGCVSIYRESTPGVSDWSEVEKLTGEDDEVFGVAVAIDQDRIAVTSRRGRGLEAFGTVSLFKKEDEDRWNLEQRVEPADAQGGDDFGGNLALSGRQLLVTASLEDIQGIEAGAVYLFEQNNGGDEWREIQKLTAFDREPGDLFGFSVDLESGNAFIGSLRTEGSGGAYLLRISPTLLSTNLDDEIVLNRRTGLFEQKIRVRNLSTEILPGIIVTGEGLPPGVILYNGSLVGGDATVSLSGPIAGLADLEIVLEYYSPTRTSPEFLSVSAVTTTLEPSSFSSGPVIEVSRIQMNDAGAAMVEFATEIGLSYQVQYSSDMTNWIDAGPPISAGGTRVAWLDQGLPKTKVHPKDAAQRFYRLRLVAR